MDTLPTISVPVDHIGDGHPIFQMGSYTVPMKFGFAIDNGGMTINHMFWLT